MRGRVVAALRPLGAIAVENVACPGTPDVAHVLGWIELKQISRWPARAETPLRVPHFRPEQRLWIRRWCCAAGPGSVTVLLRVGKEWLLLPGPWAADHLGNAKKATVLEATIVNLSTRWEPKLLLEGIRNIQDYSAGWYP
jgi:hypothetical protein